MWKTIYSLSKITYLMKKKAVYPTVFFCMLLLSSCQKGLNYSLDPVPPPPTVYYINFSVNGDTVNYSGVNQASFTKDKDSLYNFNVMVGVAPSTYLDRVQINIVDANAIVTGKEYEGDVLPGKPRVTITYNDASNRLFSSAVSKNNANVRVMLTENTADHITGTFSGNLQNADDVARGDYSKVKVITAGTFFVKK